MTEFLEPALFQSIKERSTSKFNRDTEKFFNHKITKVEVTVVTIWKIINLLFIAQVYSAWAHNCMYTWDCVIL